MSDNDLRHSVDEMRLGAAALGVCIARTIAKENPTLLRSFATEAERIHQNLSELGRPEVGNILISFSLALAHPEKFPLFGSN